MNMVVKQAIVLVKFVSPLLLEGGCTKRNPWDLFKPPHKEKLKQKFRLSPFFAILLWIFIIPGFLSGCGATELTDAEYVQRAKDSQDQGQLTAAIIELKNALNQNGNNIEARMLLATVYVEIGDGASAEKELLRARELGVSKEGIAILLAKSFILQGKNGQVITDILPQDIRSNTGKARLYALRGKAYIGDGKMEDAAEALKIALELEPNLTSAQTGQARLALIQGHTDKAGSWIDKALAVEPNSAEAWSLKGDLARNQQNAKEAEEAYSKAIANRTANANDYLKRAIMRIDLGDYDGAESDIKAIGKQFREHLEVNFVQGYLYYKQKQYGEAQTEFETMLKKKNDDMRAVFYLGVAHAMQSHTEQADLYLSRFLDVYPNSIYVAKLLGSVRMSKGDYVGAEAVLQPLLDRDPNDTEVLNLLGGAALPQGKSKESIEYFRRVIAEQSHSATAHMNLGLGLLVEKQYEKGIRELKLATEIEPQLQGADYLVILGYLKNNEIDKAIAAAEKLREKQPDDPKTLTLLAGAYLSKGDEDKTRDLLNQALQVSPGDPSAAGNLARLELSRNEVDKAKSLYEEILKYHPTHIDTLIALAQLDYQQGNIKEALARLEYIVKENPQDIRSRVQLASIYLRTGQPARVIDIVREVPDADSNPYILGVTGEAQLALNYSANAESTFRKLVKLLPKSARAHYLLAKSYASLNQTNDVYTELSKALEIDPNYLPAKLALARLDVGENRLEDAGKIISELEQAYPSHPEVLALQGGMATRENRPKEAVEAYQKAFELAPSSQLVVLLSTAQWQANDKDGSIGTYINWLEKHPTDVGVHLALANSYLLLDSPDKAKAGFAKVVELSPNNVLALNNLASLLRKEDPEKALVHTEHAFKLAPDNPVVMDTLGELLLDKGEIVRALRLFNDASQKAPDNLDIRYHLALAFSKAGKSDTAHQILQDTLAEKRPFKNEQEAKELLKSLGG